MPLTTDQLILRSPQPEDLSALVDLALFNPDEMKNKASTASQRFQEGEALFLVIEHLIDRNVMGILEIDHRGQFTCALGEKFQNKGYAEEATETFIYLIFSLFEIEKIHATAGSLTFTREAFLDHLFTKPRKLIWGVIGALIRQDGALFLSRRQSHQTFPGAWEFPGGKIEAGETPEAALIREMAEEVGVDLAPHHLKPLSFTSYPYKTVHMVLHLYVCRGWEGEPRGKEGQEVSWIFPKDFHRHPTPAASIFLLNHLFENL